MTLIALDLGGTWMRGAIVTPDGRSGPLERRPTRRERPPQEIITDLLATIEQVRHRAAPAMEPIAGVAIGVPTVIDAQGCLGFADNLPTLGGYPLRAELQTRIDLPLALFNDASCYTMGEWWRGAGQGTRTFCGVTLGTGIGLGFVLNGQYYHGSHDCAGEIWKSPLGSGTVEDQISGAGLERTYRGLAGQERPGPAIAQLAAGGDPAALRAYAEFGRTLGQALAYLVNILDPEVIAFGGSIAASFPHFSAALQTEILAHTVAGAHVRLLPSALGEQAALLGAAWLYCNTTGAHTAG